MSIKKISEILVLRTFLAPRGTQLINYTKQCFKNKKEMLKAVRFRGRGK